MRGIARQPRTDAEEARNNAYILADLEMMAQARNYFAWQRRLIAPHLGRRVLDVGCGVGNLTGRLLDREAVIAVDKDPECIARLTRRHGHRSSLVAVVADATAPEFAALARFGADSCLCANVLEHIWDHRKALGAMVEAIAPRGTVVLLVPAFQALYGPIDANVGHYRRYSRRALVDLAESAGLRIEAVRCVNLPGLIGWWLNARVFRKQAQSERQIAFFDRYLVPAVSLIENLVPPPLGQSLLLVARKP
jgi:SAM-dependent methyltransferase